MAKIENETPYCTVCLVIGALLCHSAVLYGNLETGDAMTAIGTSTSGWSKVGLGLSRSFRGELDVLMGNITDKLGEAINQSMAAQKYIDIVVSMVGNSTEDAGQQAAMLLQQGALPAGALFQLPAPGASKNKTLPDTILGGVNQTMVMVMDKLTSELNLFMEKLKPGLIQVGKMIIKFGDKIIQVLESFSVSLDKVQKIFDQIMGQLSSSKAGLEVEEKMVHDTYTLFDVSHTGTISQDDLEEVAQLYSISAFQGTKPKELVKKYDRDGDKQLDKAEFTRMTKDVSIPKSMAVVLRAYAKRLTAVAGNVASARKRDEVALAVVKYFQLVCAKNRTKLAWVSDTLGNGSLPLAFTADIFKNLAMQVDNPDVLTTADVGQVVISTMMDLHPKQVMDAVDLMAKTDYWESEGFDPKEHPLVMKRVSTWVTQAKKPTGLLSFLEEEYISEDALERMPAMAEALAEENMDRHLNEKFKASASQRAALFHTESSRYLLHHLLGGVAAGDTDSDAASRSLNSGVAAKPETLEFAKFLSWNASATAERFQKQSFAYTSESSSSLDSFANQIQGMVKKITGFIKMMEKYSTPAGIDKLEKQIEGFAEKASDDMIKVVNKKLGKVVNDGAPKLQEGINQAVTNIGDQVGDIAADKIEKPLVNALKNPIEQIVGKALNNTEAGVEIGDMLGDAVSDKLKNLTGKALSTKVSDLLNNSINDAIAKAGDLIGNTMDKMEGPDKSLLDIGSCGASCLESFSEQENMQQDLNGAFDKIASLLRTFLKFLPQATDNLKFAKQEVGEAAKVMDNVFGIFQHKGPAIFDKIASLYKVLWTLYFVALLPMTLGLLYYGFWASGYFGGPLPAEGSIVDDDGPRSFMDRCRMCCSACNFCMKNFHDTQLCFWSCLILFEVVCLLIFVISLVLCILSGVKTFMVAGCSQVYLLNDEKICYETVKVLRSFTETFFVSDPSRPLEDVCGFNNLLTCDLIASKFKQATLLTTVFSFLAAVLSFQMIIESANLHTRARYRRIVAAIKDEEDHASF